MAVGAASACHKMNLAIIRRGHCGNTFSVFGCSAVNTTKYQQLSVKFCGALRELRGAV